MSHRVLKNGCGVYQLVGRFIQHLSKLQGAEDHTRLGRDRADEGGLHHEGNMRCGGNCGRVRLRRGQRDGGGR